MLYLYVPKDELMLQILVKLTPDWAIMYNDR